jgi:hypothetical protein
MLLRALHELQDAVERAIDLLEERVDDEALPSAERERGILLD